MFDKKRINFTSIADGEVFSIEDVDDPVFSSRILGDGFAVNPIDNKIYSPVKGRIKSIFPTKHAIYLADSEGNEFLIHMGIDTVELKGKGFKILVKENEKVRQGSLLAEMDIQLIEKEYKKRTTAIVVLVNSSNRINVTKGFFSHGELVGFVDN